MADGFYRSSSTTRPLNIDAISSKKFVYLRQNIEEKTETDPVTGTTTTLFVYDEKKVDKVEYYQDRVKQSSAEIAVLQADNEALKKQLDEQADALIELASLIG